MFHWHFSFHAQADEVLRFEVDSSKLSELLAQVSDIEKALETHSHVS